MQYYTTHAGETLAGVALRELGDTRYWRVLKSFNDMREVGPDCYLPPFVDLRIPNEHHEVVAELLDQQQCLEMFDILERQLRGELS